MASARTARMRARTALVDLAGVREGLDGLGAAEAARARGLLRTAEGAVADLVDELEDMLARERTRRDEQLVADAHKPGAIIGAQHVGAARRLEVVPERSLHVADGRRTQPHFPAGGAA